MSIKFKILNALLLRISPISPNASMCMQRFKNTASSSSGNLTKNGNNESIHQYRVVINDSTLLYSHFILVKSKEQTVGQMQSKKKLREIFFPTLYIFVLSLIFTTNTRCLFNRQRATSASIQYWNQLFFLPRMRTHHYVQ